MDRHSLRRGADIGVEVCVQVLGVVWGFAFVAAVKLSVVSAMKE